MNNEKLTVFFSVLQYVPSDFRGEKINVGIAFHIPELSKVEFFKVKNTRRIRSFDDEHMDFYKYMIDNIEDMFTFPKKIIELEYPEYNNNEYKNIDENYFLPNKTYYFNNQFQFMPVQTFESTINELEDNKEEFKKVYLYFDRPKSERATTAYVKNRLAHQMRLLKKSDDVEKSPDIYDVFNMTKIFDYKFNDLYVMTIGFDYASDSQLAKEMSSKLYNINYLKEKKIIKKMDIIVDDLAENTNQFKKFKKQIDEISSTEDININLVKLSEFN